MAEAAPTDRTYVLWQARLVTVFFLSMPTVTYLGLAPAAAGRGPGDLVVFLVVGTVSAALMVWAFRRSCQVRLSADGLEVTAMLRRYRYRWEEVRRADPVIDRGSGRSSLTLTLITADGRARKFPFDAAGTRSAKKAVTEVVDAINARVGVTSVRPYYDHRSWWWDT